MSLISGLKTAQERLWGKDSQKTAVLVLLVLLCAGATYYSHFILHIEVVFSHLSYVPIALAGLWWGRRGAWVAVLLGALLIASHFLSGLGTPPQEDFLRSVMFVAAGLMVGLLRDQAQRSEKNLRETRDYLDNLIGCANAPIIVWDRKGRITLFNHAFERLTGYTAGEVMGQDLRLLFPGASRDESLSKIARTLSGEYWESVEIPILCQDGETRLALWNSANIYAEDGTTLLATIAQGQDITERKRAEERIEHLNLVLRAIRRVNQLITRERNLDRLLKGACDNLIETRGYYNAWVALLDEAGGLVTAAEVGLGEDFLPLVEQLKRGELTACGRRALSQPGVVVTEDPLSACADCPLSVNYGGRGAMTVWLEYEGKVYGLLSVSIPADFTADEEEHFLFKEVAGDIAFALYNMELEEARKRAEKALKRRAAQLATLGEVGRQITSLLELDPLLDHIVNLTRESFNYRYVSILLIDPATGKLAPKAGAGFDVEPVKARHLRVGEESICGWVAASGEPLLVGDVSQEPRYYPQEVLADIRSELAVPIQVRGQVIGVLDVESTELEAFDEEDLFTLRTLADQVAVALENAGLYQELHDYAEQLEQRVQERTAQLQAQYARLDAILRSTSDGIAVTGTRGEIIQTNPVAHAWLTQTLSPEDTAYLREAVRDLARRAGERPETVLELTGLDLQLNAAPISDPGLEEAAAAVVAVHDVSHLKALDRMKSRFVSNVSHELRTPATTIKLYAHLMRHRPEKREQYLDMLEQEADRQARLVEEILQISRLDAGRLEVEPRLTSLNELTEVAFTSHQVLARDRGLTLEHHPMEPGPVALMDPQQMMQVLNNLVRNAIQYTPEDGRVVISTGKEETPPSIPPNGGEEGRGRVWATATVADTGMGVPEEELPHIFERFFRGEQPRLTQIPGTGLGLAIVKEIVELHGGQVTVESQVGEGTTFTVWLPITENRR